MIVAISSLAAAESPPPPAECNCPDRARVLSELHALGEARSPQELSILDHGDRYRVSVAGQTRELSDPARDCDARARAAAAFALLVLRPPTMAPPTATPPPARRAFSPPSAELEAGAIFEGAPRTAPDNSLTGLGAALRGVLHWRYLGLSFGVDATSPDTLALADRTHARLWHVPLDASLRLLAPLGRVDLTGDVGAGATLVHVVGIGLKVAEAATTAEPTLRAALGIRIWLASRLALLIGLHTVLSLSRSQIAVAPTGVVGTTPVAWLGIGAGLAVRVH
jgi:hypothetical protein